MSVFCCLEWPPIRKFGGSLKRSTAPKKLQLKSCRGRVQCWVMSGPFFSLSRYMHFMRRFVASQEKYVWIVSLPSSAKKRTNRRKLLRWRGANDTVCTVSAITNCDALAVYNFSGETFSCRLTGGRKDKFKPLKISSLVRRNWRSWNLCRWNLLRMDGKTCRVHKNILLNNFLSFARKWERKQISFYVCFSRAKYFSFPLFFLVKSHKLYVGRYFTRFSLRV